jgi:hypothetical protein
METKTFNCSKCNKVIETNLVCRITLDFFNTTFGRVNPNDSSCKVFKICHDCCIKMIRALSNKEKI